MARQAPSNITSPHATGVQVNDAVNVRGAQRPKECHRVLISPPPLTGVEPGCVGACPTDTTQPTQRVSQPTQGFGMSLAWTPRPETAISGG